MQNLKTLKALDILIQQLEHAVTHYGGKTIITRNDLAVLKRVARALPLTRVK